MKLGVSYNIFDDSIELLETSIKQIRGKVEYISIVYQNISNHGVNSKVDIKKILENFLEINLIDEIYLYTPNLNNPSIHELNKRNIGLELSRKNNCTYHMSMDSDEFYTQGQFTFLIDYIKNNPDIEGYFCNMRTYYKDVNIQITPPEDYFVSLFYKINNKSEFILGGYTPVLVDPTRRIPKKQNKVFNRDEIEMHHMSYVRNDIKHKLINSSALVNYKNNVDILVDYYNDYEFPMKALMAGNPLRFFNVIKTEFKW